jgi:anti-anti-sigma factor
VSLVMAKVTFDYINQLNLPFIDKYEIIKNIRVLRFRGSIDSDAVSKILNLKKQIEKYEDINRMNTLIDLKKVVYGDTAATAALIMRLAELRQRGKKIGLINVPPDIKHMFEILKCDKLFLIFESEKEALENLKNNQI